MTTNEIGRHVGLNGMQPHNVALRIVQAHGDEINVHHSRKALGKISKQLMKIPVNGNRLCDLQEGLVPIR